MELKQRKKINNIPKFNSGTNDLSSSVNSIGGDITGINTYKKWLTSSPTIKEINGMKTPSASLGGGAFSNVNAGTVTGAVNGTLGIISGFNQQQAAVKDQSGLFGMSGQRTDQAFGVNYQAQNDINKRQPIVTGKQIGRAHV